MPNTSPALSDAVPDPQAALASSMVALASSVAALESSELRYRRLFETARDGILLLDPGSGTITDVNPFMVELMGMERDEFMGRELWELGLFPGKASGREAFARLVQDKFLRFEAPSVQTRRDTNHALECVCNLYRENGHTVIQCNIRDITERKQAEADLATAAARNERIAETLQRSLLQAPPPGRFSRLAVETLYAATLHEAAVGGDFFDTFEFDGGKVALIVGDVSGKGLRAAEHMAEVKYALRAFLHAHINPDAALVQLNDFVWDTYRRDDESQETFIILSVAVVDTETGETLFATAGAEPILVLRADGTAEQVQTSGRPLGILPDAAYTSISLQLEAGDTVLMATDGITEARQGREFLGQDGLTALVQQAGPSVPLPELREAIYGGARDFAGGELHDDVCLLLARRL